VCMCVKQTMNRIGTYMNRKSSKIDAM